MLTRTPDLALGKRRDECRSCDGICNNIVCNNHITKKIVIKLQRLGRRLCRWLHCELDLSNVRGYHHYSGRFFWESGKDGTHTSGVVRQKKEGALTDCCGLPRPQRWQAPRRRQASRPRLSSSDIANPCATGSDEDCAGWLHPSGVTAVRLRSMSQDGKNELDPSNECQDHQYSGRHLVPQQDVVEWNPLQVTLC